MENPSPHQELLNRYNAWMATFQVMPNMDFKQWYNKQYLRQWQLKHPEKCRESTARYQKEHKKKFRKSQKRYWKSQTKTARNKNNHYSPLEVHMMKIFIENGLKTREIAYILKRTMYSVNFVKHKIKCGWKPRGALIIE